MILNTTRWVSIVGQFNLDGDILAFKPERLDGDPTAQQAGHFGLARTNIQFDNGSIKFETRLGGPDSQCQVVFNSHESHMQAPHVFVGLNSGGFPYGIRIYQNNEWIPLAWAGVGSTLRPNDWISVQIDVKGSTVNLSVDDVKVCQAEVFIARSQLAIYAAGNHGVEVRNFNVTTQKRSAFIVMQFEDKFDKLYTEVIKPTCEQFDIECIRADDIYSCGLILDDISRSISEAYIIIADITPDNPNVFYEVGYAHGIQKPVILLCNRERSKLPFDISGMRTLFYNDSIGGKRTVEEKLRKHLGSILGVPGEP